MQSRAQWQKWIMTLFCRSGGRYFHVTVNLTKVNLGEGIVFVFFTLDMEFQQISWIADLHPQLQPQSTFQGHYYLIREGHIQSWMPSQQHFAILELLNLEKLGQVSWLWVSPVQNLRKTPPKGHVYSSVGLGFIVLGHNAWSAWSQPSTSNGRVSLPMAG